MFATLANFDPISAAGVLARAAVSIEEEENPAAEAHVPDERNIRRALLSEVRQAIGVRVDDCSPEALERVADALDAEAERLVGPTDEVGALDRLAINGDLPSDLYQVNVIGTVSNFHGKHFPEEEARIKLTVKCPDQEMHYGPAVSPTTPALVSLFSKKFDNKFPYRSFILLVVGQRRGVQLDVHQAWRIYADLVDVDGAESLVEVLRRFSDRYGVEMEIDGKRGKLITLADIDNNRPLAAQVNVNSGNDPKRKAQPRTTTFSMFMHNPPSSGGAKAVFAIALDLDKYRETLEQRGW